jgi:hypothetical protein
MRIILDGRTGAVDHSCAGVWHYAGLNAGGHELYRCDAGQHALIFPHVAADHECAPECCQALTMTEARELTAPTSLDDLGLYDAAERSS